MLTITNNMMAYSSSDGFHCEAVAFMVNGMVQRVDIITRIGTKQSTCVMTFPTDSISVGHLDVIIDAVSQLNAKCVAHRAEYESLLDFLS